MVDSLLACVASALCNVGAMTWLDMCSHHNNSIMLYGHDSNDYVAFPVPNCVWLCCADPDGQHHCNWSLGEQRDQGLQPEASVQGV